MEKTILSGREKEKIKWKVYIARGKYFALQDDFSGLVSPKMFREFFLKQQEKISRQLDNSIYHLDGPMALGNLGSLLEIDSLDGIQWVPGVGSKSMSKWLDVCTCIQDAGKCLQIDCEPHEVEFLLSKLKHEGLLLCAFCMSKKEAQNVLKIMERHSK